MTLREIIENLDRLNVFLRTTGKIAGSNKSIENRQHENQKGWDRLLADYEEFLMDVERMLDNAIKRENHRKNAFIRTLANLEFEARTKKEIETLKKMGYTDFEIDILRKYKILKKFFTNESEKIKDGGAVVNDKIKRLLRRFNVLEAHLVSINTEARKCLKK